MSSKVTGLVLVHSWIHPHYRKQLSVKAMAANRIFRMLTTSNPIPLKLLWHENQRHNKGGPWRASVPSTMLKGGTWLPWVTYGSPREGTRSSGLKPCSFCSVVSPSSGPSSKGSLHMRINRGTKLPAPPPPEVTSLCHMMLWQGF